MDARSTLFLDVFLSFSLCLIPFYEVDIVFLQFVFEEFDGWVVTGNMYGHVSSLHLAEVSLGILIGDDDDLLFEMNFGSCLLVLDDDSTLLALL